GVGDLRLPGGTCRRLVGVDEFADAVEPERAHCLAKVAPAAQIPVRVDRLDPSRVDTTPLAVALGVEVIELDLHSPGDRVADQGERGVRFGGIDRDGLRYRG